MEKVLSVIDQLTGFIMACAMVLPSKKLEDVAMKSMLKKWKNKAFAAGTMRERIEEWTEKLETSLEYMLAETLVAMQGVHEELGL
jgi:predicted hydrolase (HD superfamily)